jgi:dienelactone hydrolase
VSVLPGEGSFVILYGGATFAVATRTHHGYVARPDVAGSFPVAVVLGPEGPGTRDLCRRLARHGVAAVALEPSSGRDATDLIRWVKAPGSPWADVRRIAVVVLGPGVPTGTAIGAADAVVVFDATDVDPSGRPLLGLFGGEGAEAEAARSAQIPASQWVFYAGVSGGFWDIDADGYVEAAADDAVIRVVSFLIGAVV